MNTDNGVASELGSVRPQTGGYYKWVQEAFGEFWAFCAGWWRTVSIYIDNTLYVILAGGYAAQQWDLGTVPEFILKFSMIALFALLNIKGLKEVGAVSTLLSALVFIGFACVAVCGFMHWGADPSATLQMTPEPAEGIGDWFFYIAGGISVVMWQYSGYESMNLASCLFMANKIFTPMLKLDDHIKDGVGWCSSCVELHSSCCLSGSTFQPVVPQTTGTPAFHARRIFCSAV